MRMRLLLLMLALGFFCRAADAQQRELTLVSFDYPPLMEAASAQRPASGMAVDIVSEAFQRMKVPMRIVFYPLARGLAMLESGQADGIFTIKKNPEREARFLFPTRPLLSQDYVIFVRKNSKIVFDGDITSLENISLGVLNRAYYGPVFEAALQAGLFKKLDIANSHKGNFQKLLAQRTDAVICSRIVGLTLLRQLNAENEVVVSGPVLDTAPSYIMFSRQTITPEFIRQFDATIAAMHEDGTFASIAKKYPQ
ncbi:transporter substrate-binding domain-containing protein [Pseudoduganella danionis]|uniref:Transporter substrate-binding domain-containing protein n=3 Tax=Pseudoduganella danionis TaxID=1890295 RepID=A0ABW9SS42_9BURK|nr:transporter substrate-binding domain-containing protein [Pseudoduganella danionis]